MEQIARARGKWVHNVMPPALPEEFIVWEILVRLPAKDLVRSRAVCRTWYRLTAASSFLLAHHRHQPSLPLLSFDSNNNAAFDALDLRQRPTERQPILRFNNYCHRESFKVHASCDGLILMSLPYGRFYLCNPAMHQWISLPRLNSTRVVGMYLHRPSGKYRVLSWRKKGKKQLVDHAEEEDVVYYVLTIDDSSNTEPRCIGQPITSPAVQTPTPRLSCLHRICYTSVPRQNTIVVFDTVRESFRLMCLPIDARHWMASFLLEIDGTLGISRGCETMVKLWVYETEAWSLKYQIELPMAELQLRNPLVYGVIVFENGESLIHCGLSRKLFHLDKNGKLLQRFQWDGVFSTTGFRFKESLVRHAFLERPKRGGYPPRFFRGLWCMSACASSSSS